MTHNHGFSRQAGLTIVLASALSIQAAELYLRNADDLGNSLSLPVGATGSIEIVLEVADGEIFGYANVFFDTSPADASAMVQIQQVTVGLAAPFFYDRSNYELPAAISLSGGNEYGLVMGQGSVTGPATVVLDTIDVAGLVDGLVEVAFETGARQPTLSTPSFAPYSLAPVGFEPGFPDFLYLGAGDDRSGGAGTFTIVVGNATPPNDNTTPTNDNSTTGNDNATDPNSNTGGEPNDNSGPANGNDGGQANDNVVIVVRPEDPEVDINENGDGELLGTVEDSEGQIAVFIERDSNGNAVRITGLVLDYRGTVVRLTLDGNLLRLIETADGTPLDISYDIDAGTVTLQDENAASVTVVLPSEIDLGNAAGAGAGAIAGESGAESMERLLDELSGVMGPIVQALGEDSETVALLAGFGGIEILEYAFQIAAANVEDAVTGDNVTDNVDFGNGGDASIDDPLGDLDDLTEPGAGAPPRTGGGGSKPAGLCGFGMIGALAMSLAGLMSLRFTKRLQR